MGEAQPARRAWLRALAVLFVAGAAFAGSGAATCAYHVFSPKPLPPASTTTTVVKPTASVVTAIRDLATLECASYHMERVIDLRDRQTHLFGLVHSEDSVLLVAAAEVVAGVDLTTMRDGDISFDPEAKTAYVTLPQPVVLSARLDNARTYVHTRKTDTLAARAETLETRARNEAERTLREAALHAGILERARANARSTIETLVRSLGFERVHVVFRKE